MTHSDDPIVIADASAEQLQPQAEVSQEAAASFTKEDIIAQLRVLVDSGDVHVKDAVDALKQEFYKLKKGERVIFSAEEQSETEQPTVESVVVDPLEEQLKELLNTFREKRVAFVAQQEQERQQNLERKVKLYEELKSLLDDQDNINRHYERFQQIQKEFREITNLPQAAINDLWKNFQLVVEQFYDMLKINKELRDYDFKKNLEHKTALCEIADSLAEREDVIAAFRELQVLHDEWRTIGPVSKEIREEIWGRFKKASTIINKRHQSHFEAIKDIEQKNEESKIALCEEIEVIDFSTLNSFNAWEEKTKEIIALQEKWRAIGYASHKMNNLLYERFRKVCDAFFKQKGEYFKGVKEEFSKNLDYKTQLCEKAEALKESTDWKKTADQLIALQKEWKTIGPVPKKFSDSLWRRFVEACDYFFEQKNKQTSSQRAVELENLAQKREVIAALKGIEPTMAANEGNKQVKALMAKWNEIGFVPFKEKDRIYKEYKEILDTLFSQFNMQMTQKRLQNYSSSVKEMHGGDGKNNILRERERLMRAFEHAKQELATYNNNLGFFTASSKSGQGLLKEMERKMIKLQEDMEVIVKKIDIIDQNL